MNKLLTGILAMIVGASAQAGHTYENELALAGQWLAAQRMYDNVPGLSVAIVLDQELAFSGGFGLADIENQTPAEADTIYGICSISKLFTGIAVMQLRDRGRFDLDDPLAELLPWFNLRQAFEGSPEPTLRGALTHSAGLPRESDYPYWDAPDFEFPTREAVKARLGEQATIYPAGRYYQYSNLGLTLAGEVVAEHSGQDYHAYVREHVLGPLQLNDTETAFPTDEREPRVATGYSYPGRDQALEPMPRYDARAIAPAAGFASTALDLARFASWQFRALGGDADAGEVLAGNTLREMQRVQWMDWDWKVARGLAFGVYRVGDRTLSGHAGSCPGFNTRLFLDPVKKVAVAVLANRNNVDVDGYAAGIFDILDAGGTVENPPQTDGLDDYVGRYDIAPWGGEQQVFRWKDGLAVISLPTSRPVDGLTALKHVEGDRFHTVRGDGAPGHEIRFVRDGSGKVTHMNVHSTFAPKL